MRRHNYPTIQYELFPTSSSPPPFTSRQLHVLKRMVDERINVLKQILTESYAPESLWHDADRRMLGDLTTIQNSITTLKDTL